jgi:hypothetical protein
MAAYLGTLTHLFIVAKSFAVLGAARANLRTEPARGLVTSRPSEHEVRAGLTDISTVEEEPDVLHFGVTTALLQAVSHCFQTNGVALLAIGDAPLHVMRHLLC